ncbi:MAG: ribosomal RNA small subunit methyltransferase A [Planctomycetes bacterium]|nr:ribosomal RNA small subunit methyltransferase A [Planctomycetota bacterium]
MPQTLTQIKSLLAERGLTPRHRFGQNFLHDANKLAAILVAADLSADDVILEVGPGTGVLTEAMLEAGARVVAVELDRDMVMLLRDRLGPDSDRFTLIEGDALDGKHALNTAIDAALGGRGKPFKLVANLPYNIASPLLAILAADWPGMTLGIVMIQREVADRLVAAPGSKTYGPISVILQAMCELDVVTNLSPHCFWPKPKVDSAVVRLRRRAAPLCDDPHALSAFLQTLFSKRRKQIGAILGRDQPMPPGLDLSLRPEQLSVEQIIALCSLHMNR